VRRTAGGTAILAEFSDAAPQVGEVEGMLPGATGRTDMVGR